MTGRSTEFIAISEEADHLAEREIQLDETSLKTLEGAAEDTGRSWSQSNLGYQANVYYADFLAPPPGAMFSREWGFLGMFQFRGRRATGVRTRPRRSQPTSRSSPVA